MQTQGQPQLVTAQPQLVTAQPQASHPTVAVTCMDTIEEIEGSRGLGFNLADKILTVLERALALVVLIMAAPVMIIIAILIRLDSPGRAIFKQQRIARLDRSTLRQHFAGQEKNFDGTADQLVNAVPTFTLYKFRTYYDRSAHLAPGRAEFDFGNDAIGDVKLQLKDDPRITRVGRFLRRTSLDELPNFINILKGEMRLIGPRPEVREMFKYYTYEQIKKFSVKPGLTGMAQVNGRGRLNFRETLHFDLWYVANRTLSLDLRILVKTLRVVLLGDGSY